MSEIQAVVFNLNGIRCGADTSNIQEIVQYNDITSLPKMPKCIDGIINIRGKVVPVINLNKRFKTGETPVTKKTKIIITGINGINVGYIVNEVSEIVKFPWESVEQPSMLLSKVSKNYIECIGKKDGELLVILDLTKVLTEKEFKQLEKNKENS